MPGGYGTKSTPWGSSGSSSGTTAPGQSGGYNPGGSNQAAENINQQKEERRNQVIQAQQDERDWANEFGGTVTQEVKDAYVPMYDYTKTNYGGISSEYQDYLDRLTRYTNDQGFSWYEEEGVPWSKRRDDQLISAFGGITGDWDPDTRSVNDD